MLAVDTPVYTSKGGISCRYCKFWQKYTTLELETNGLVGKWGSCSNIDNKAKALANPDAFREYERDRINVQIVKTGVFSVRVYTTDSYKCHNYREKIVEENNET